MLTHRCWEEAAGPRTSIGTYGEILVMTLRGRCVAETRIRDADGRLRKVTATASSPRAATARLEERLLESPSRGMGKVKLSPAAAALAVRLSRCPGEQHAWAPRCS